MSIKGVPSSASIPLIISLFRSRCRSLTSKSRLGWDGLGIGLRTHHVLACWDRAGELPSELHDLRGQASKAESERVNVRYPAILQKTGLKSQWCTPFQKIYLDMGLFPGFDTECVLHR